MLPRNHHSSNAPMCLRCEQTYSRNNRGVHCHCQLLGLSKTSGVYNYLVAGCKRDYPHPMMTRRLYPVLYHIPHTHHVNASCSTACPTEVRHYSCAIHALSSLGLVPLTGQDPSGNLPCLGQFKVYQVAFALASADADNVSSLSAPGVGSRCL